MEESIILTFLECITHFSTLSLPFQLMNPVCILAGVFAGVRLEQKWYLFAGILVLLVLACEGVCWLFDILRVFPLFFTGFMALCVLTGDLIGTVICKLWTNIHH